MQDSAKPRLTPWQIVQMNAGFLGLQYSFGLQQGNMGPIYSVLGASAASLPLLQLAGPVTGLVLQPLIGAMSDRTVTRLGRRTPYFLVGAGLCSAALLAMPFSPSLAVAIVLLWLLDAGNNVTLEPYRAYVSDRLRTEQQRLGFLSQAAFTGLAQTAAYLTPSLLVAAGLSVDATGANGIPVTTLIAFLLGGVLSIGSVVISVVRVGELPLSAGMQAQLRGAARGPAANFREIAGAIRAMPPAMRRMGPMCLCQWYAMVAYWNYSAYAIARGRFGGADPAGSAFRHAVLVNGRVGALYNAVAFIAGFAMVPVSRRIGAVRTHAAALALGAVAMMVLPLTRSSAGLYLPAIGIGIAWGSMMGNPYVLLAGAVPPARTGVYMGIFNLFIVIPMVIESVTLPLAYGSVLAGDPRRVLVLAGFLMLLAAASALRVPEPARADPAALG